MGDAVSGIDAARHRDGAAHELSLKGSGKALDGRQKVIHIRQRCRNLSTRDFPGLFIGQAVLDEGSADVDQKILFHLISCFLLVVLDSCKAQRGCQLHSFLFRILNTE